MPGKGTLKGGTMTGGKAGMAAVGCATLCGRAAGSSGTVCTAVTGDGTVETVTTVTGDTATVEVTAATGVRSATTVAFVSKKKKKILFFPLFVWRLVWLTQDCVLTCNGHRRGGRVGGVWTGGECARGGRG